MSRPSGPDSPLRRGSNASAGFASRQDAITLSNATYSGGPYAPARPSQTSPPGSQHPSSSTDMSRPSAIGSSIGRPPSSASSMTRSSFGHGSGPPPMGGQRPVPKLDIEEALQRHYVTLRSYLSSSLRDEKGNIRPNRARDKLLRLSPTQFTELSTDVFDELIRREDERVQRVANVPRFLPPKSVFHPKRNQARQKLSTLPLDRFKQLATDVFYELERRMPRIAASEMSRPGSAASSRSRGGGPRPPGPGFRPPGARPNGSFDGYGPGSPILPPGARPPQPKSFQSNTIIPNKSTMVEDDEVDEDDEEDAFGLDRVMSGLAGKNKAAVNESDMKKIEEQEREINELKAKVDELKAASNVQDDLKALREELEQKNLKAEELNENLRRELEQLRSEKEQREREMSTEHEQNIDILQKQLDDLQNQTQEMQSLLDSRQSENDALNVQLRSGLEQSSNTALMEQRIQALEAELAELERLTEDVRGQAAMYFQEMKALSQQNDRAVEREDKMAEQVARMEKEIDGWRHRYARVKAQNRSLRASTMGLDLKAFDTGSLFRKDALVSENGLVKDLDITRFQLSVEELLQAARQPATQPMLDSVKNVVISVQSITSTIGTDGYPTPVPSPQSGEGPQPVSVGKLKARVMATANTLITATKQHSSAMGLSPVALLDAAASNLSSAVVDLVKVVGVRPSPKSELHDTILDLDVSGPPSFSHASGSSFYDDSISPDHRSARTSVSGEQDVDGTLNHAPLEIQVQPPPASHSSASSLADPAEPVSPPSALKSDQPKPGQLNLGGLGRSNTMKKWFGWGRAPEEEMPTPIATTPQTATPIGGPAPVDDYEAFS